MGFAKNGIKTMRLAAAAAAATLAVPLTPAFAQYSPDELLTNAGRDAGFKTNAITPATIAGWVTTMANWAVGIAVSLFVGRVVLTAVDRMILANMDTTAHVPGAYPNPGDNRWDDGRQQGGEAWTWAAIFKHFGKQLAIAAGVWILVQVVMGLVSMFFSAAVAR